MGKHRHMKKLKTLDLTNLLESIVDQVSILLRKLRFAWVKIWLMLASQDLSYMRKNGT